MNCHSFNQLSTTDSGSSSSSSNTYQSFLNPLNSNSTRTHSSSIIHPLMY